jgi:pimeloyl-ACP methyl ester carboxylesterase
MNKKVWEDFVPSLDSNSKIYTIDLPGFGESPKPLSFSLSSVAMEVLNWMNELKLPPCALIGHSLGGYVALAMVEKNPERFAGFGLMHSTALPDSAEKKQSRDKVIEFVQKNGAPAFTTNFIPPLFADKNHPAIETVREISKPASAEVVIGYTKAMRDRVDTTGVFKSFDKPVLFIVGKEDPGIPVESVKNQSMLCRQPEFHVLEKVGHMAMFEAPQTTAEIVLGFSQKVLDL